MSLVLGRVLGAAGAALRETELFLSEEESPYPAFCLETTVSSTGRHVA